MCCIGLNEFIDNDDMEQLSNLTAERFYLHIQEQYGNLVEKILRYYDADSYMILDQVGKSGLIDLFEKPNDGNSTVELINLKKETCNISHDPTSLKIGTKNKIIVLLKSCHAIVKKKKLRLSYQARLNRLDKCRSTTSSSSTNNSGSDSETSFE